MFYLNYDNKGIFDLLPVKDNEIRTGHTNIPKNFEFYLN